MGFSKINGTQMIFEIFGYDETGRKVEKWRINKSDFGDAVRIIANKYNMGFKILDKKKAEDRDLEWAY